MSGDGNSDETLAAMHLLACRQAVLAVSAACEKAANESSAQLHALKSRVEYVLAQAEAVDRDSAETVMQDVGSQQRLGVADINDPGLQWRDDIDPERWQASHQNPYLAVNPPGHTLPAGAERDIAWKAYLRRYPQDGTRGVLPKPDAVQDKGLKIVGYFAEQLGTSYVWAGGDLAGPGKGDHEYDKNGQPVLDERSDAFKYGDTNRVGFDCSGITEYVVGKVVDGQSIGGWTGAQLNSPLLTEAKVPLQPGDLVFYGSADAHHVAVYVAPGVVLQASESGTPVSLAMRPTDEGGAGEMVRVLRLAD